MSMNCEVEEPITIIRGTHKNINVTLRDEYGDPINLSTLDVPNGDFIRCYFHGDSELGTDPVTLRTEVNEQQKVVFSAVPDAGTWKLSHSGNETAALNFDDDATAVQTALNNLASLSGVVVSGDYTNGFVIDFEGSDAATDQPLLVVVDSTLTSGGTAVETTVTEEVQGWPSRITRTAANLTIGKFQINLTPTESALLETGVGKDFEIQWQLSSTLKAKQIKSEIDVVDSLGE